jgi:hypothetical protein
MLYPRQLPECASMRQYHFHLRQFAIPYWRRLVRQ